MKTRILPPLLSVLGIGIASAASELPLNSRFLGNPGEYPENWVVKSSGVARIIPGGAPGGNGNSVRFTVGNGALRQYGIVVVPGEKYRMTLWVRSRNFKSGKAIAVLANSGWKQDVGFKSFPADTPWKKLDIEFTAFPSDDGLYSMAMIFGTREGEIEVAGWRLEPLSGKARAGSFSLGKHGGRRLVPLARLNRLEKPEILFSAPDEPDIVCEYRIAGQTRRIPAGKRFQLVFPWVKPGLHLLEVNCLKNGRNIEREVYPVGLLKPVNVDTSTHRRLNNLTIELLNQAASDGEKISFGNPHENWVYFSFPEAGAKIGTRTFRFREQTLFLPAGKFTLTSRGSGRVIVRSIPETLCYPLAVTLAPHGVRNDWAFLRSHAIPEVCVFSQFPRDFDFSNLEGLDVAVLNSVTSRPFRNKPFEAEKLLKLLAGTRGNSDARLKGITIDEFGWGEFGSFQLLGKVFRNYPLSRRVYTWVADPVPGGSPNLGDAISGLINAGSDGRGAILYEAYCDPSRNETDARSDLEKIMLAASMRRLREAFPDAQRHVGIILCPSNLRGFYNHLEPFSGMDGKYFLDMQMNLLANHPQMKDLAIIGYWGLNYCDEEMLRWSFRLLRHYVLEGQKEMLSDQYGFRYRTEHLKNGDFEDGLKHWKITGTVSPGKIPGYGRRIQKRSNYHSPGDTVAILARKKGVETSLTQKAEGLIPGRTYLLSYVTADKTAVEKNLPHAADPGLRVTLHNAAILPAESHRYSSSFDKKSTITYERVVFRAEKTEMEIVFDNSRAAEGSIALLNDIQLKPYYSDNSSREN